MLKKKDNRTILGSIDMLRILVLSVLFGAFILLFVINLFLLQIKDHEQYVKEVVPKTYKTQSMEMSRGHIYDRNGVPLATNKKSYNVVVDRARIDSKDYNTTLLSFIRFCNQNGFELADYLPVSQNYPYVFDEDYIFDKDKDKMFSSFITTYQLEDKNFTAGGEAFYDYLAQRYNVSEADKNDSDYRKLIGIRYDMETNSFGYIGHYTLMQNISEEARVLISESLHDFHGISITTTDERYYNMGTLASHVLGRTGKLDAEDVEEYVNQKGYAYDAIIGRQGVEKAFEDYLHGYNEKIEYEIDENNNITNKTVVSKGKNGYSVNLTIDARLQEAAENALKEQIDYARRRGLSDTIAYNGEDCNAGGVVVMSPKTGDIYACASYPTYDLNTFSQDIAKLNADDARPLVNRATQGIYPPGSTYKIVTSIAGLMEGIITKDTLIYDKGEYRKYEDYTPRCWVYVNTGGTHGYMSVKSAIENSCNYFFYEIGDKMGIDRITKYASSFGLGQKTGIEIPELSGVLASPEYRDSKGLLWLPGDTLQASIGQSDNSFTLVQLCAYMSAVINGGTRYKATLLDRVVDFYTGKTVFENKPEVLDKVDLPTDVVELLKSAMKSVVVEGTARHVFDNYEYEVGGKTGTAQVGKNKSDTALFVGFAPYDDPEIVVSVVVEHGDQSARATEVARAVFDCYFENKKADEAAKNEHNEQDEQIDKTT